MIEAVKTKYDDPLRFFSNPEKAQHKAFKYLGKTAILYKSDRTNKKYMIKHPRKDEFIHFGDIRYEDYTKHGNKIRRMRYLKRASNIKGEWKDNKYSPNNLSIKILW